MSIWNVIEKVGGIVYDVAVSLTDYTVNKIDKMSDDELQRSIDKSNSDYTVGDFREKSAQWQQRDKRKD